MPLLVTHFDALDLAEGGSRVFLPLCGKTRDIAWLLSQGYRVAGAELSELAIIQLFEELGVEPVIRNLGSSNATARQTSIFSSATFSPDCGIAWPCRRRFDRAALVALPEEMREAYADHLVYLSRDRTAIAHLFRV
jgi:thiopurine S-methyltransferase